jgi:probable rRNA maturation factor
LITVAKRVPNLKESVLRRFTRRAAAQVGLHGHLHVLVTSNRELKALNQRFRHKDQATDVLSFPAQEEISQELAGDIAVSAEMAVANATRLGHSAVEEIKILILHGILHLAGYDHERDGGEMARKEAHLRRVLRLPEGLIERGRRTGQTPAHRRKPSTGWQTR